MHDALAAGYRCRDCDLELATDRLGPCPECGGRPRVAIDDGSAATIDDVSAATWTDWLVESVDAPGIGGTPLVDLPETAAAVDVDRLAIKREGANLTGSITDRALAPAIAAAAEQDRGVHIASPGPGARSAAALAARAGIDATAVVPSRSTFDAKAMVNVHGGAMRVVEGRYADARAAATDLAGVDCAPLATGRRIAGLRTIALELATDPPDAIVAPTGHGLLPVALREGCADLDAMGAIGSVPTIVVAQSAGCAPIVDGESIDRPDTVCGILEVSDPAAGDGARSAVAATGGDAVAIADDDALTRAVQTARRDGVATSTAGGVALAAVDRIRADGLIDGDDRVAVVDPLTPRSDADILRSHLMRSGE
ncbi:MAG: pyridoxal-phosphate dependent enzyme [Halococcoides sp.]